MSVVDDVTRSPVRYLPHALAATAMVTLAPAALMWGVATAGVVTGFMPLLAVGLVASLLVAYGGRVVWQMRPGSRDVLFSDLMLWGWLRRRLAERRLGDAVALLGANAKGVRERNGQLGPEAQLRALKRLAGALEARDPYTHGHSRRVARYSTMIAGKLGVPPDEVARIRLAATLHDVGKLVVPRAILNKPGKLTDEEFAVIKPHAPVGAEMVSSIGDDELTRIVAHHHERLDGTGYPSRLAGSEIPLGARIIAVADTFDALTSTRAYRPAKRHRDVFRILGEEAGTQLDPGAVQAFIRCYSGFWGIAAWSIVTGAPQRVLLPLGSQASIAGGTLTAKTLAVLAAAAATGSAVSGSSLTDPRDTSANRIVVPAIAAVGVAAYGVDYPGSAVRSAGLPGGGNHEGGSGSTGPSHGAGENGSKGAGSGQGSKPGPGDDPGPLPDLGNPPSPDVPPIPADPGSAARQLVERQLDPLGEHSGQLRAQSVDLPEPSRQLDAQLQDPRGPLG
jgi:putative nucleotidyltransferase with HDIG domain